MYKCTGQYASPPPPPLPVLTDVQCDPLAELNSKENVTYIEWLKRIWTAVVKWPEVIPNFEFSPVIWIFGRKDPKIRNKDDVQ